MQPETRFKNKIVKLLKEVPRSHWVKVQSVAVRGIPDILGVVAGRCVALELKVPPNKLKPGSLQHFTLQSLWDAGAYAREVTPDNMEAVLKDLHQIGENNAELVGIPTVLRPPLFAEAGSKKSRGTPAAE